MFLLKTDPEICNPTPHISSEEGSVTLQGNQTRSAIAVMKKWLLHNRLLVIGIAAGAIGGFLYWQQIGCVSGSCMITSKWQNSTAYGALMGGLVFSIFIKDKNGNS